MQTRGRDLMDTPSKPPHAALSDDVFSGPFSMNVPPTVGNRRTSPIGSVLSVIGKHAQSRESRTLARAS